MSKSDAAEAGFLQLLFHATLFANIGINATAGPLTTLKVSLHKADPGEAGDQTTSEVTYGGYLRVLVNRTTAGWAYSAGSVSPVATISFPACTAGSNTVTHFGIGSASSGAGVLYYSGTVAPNIAVSSGVTARLTTGTIISEA